MAEFWAVPSLIPFLNALLIGLSLASIWFIAALGLTIIYGTMGVINMAHGEFIMLGGYTAYVLQATFGLPFLLCIPAAFLVVAIIGWFLERGVIRHLYDRPLDTLLATWGVSIILIQVVRLLFGSAPQYIETPSWMNIPVEIGALRLSGIRVFIILLSVVLLLGTWFLMFRTRWGMQVRAIVQDKEMAAAFGINTDRVYSLTFALGAGLGGVAGAMIGGLRTLFPDVGARYIVEAFLVVVTGGTQLLGSVLSAAILGQINGVFSFFTTDTFATFVMFALIVIFLRFRPQGLISDSGRRR